MSQRYDTIPTGEKSKAEKLADLLLQQKNDQMAIIRNINTNRGNYLNMQKTEGIGAPDAWGAGIEMCDGSYISIVWANGFLSVKWKLLKQLVPGEGIQNGG